MGAVTFSIDERLVKLFAGLLPLDVSVETGTFEGDAVAQVMDLFKEVHTIEIPADMLPSLRDSLGAVVYWLDAHLCRAGDGTILEGDGCSLIAELKAIAPLGVESVVLIDDAASSSPPARIRTGRLAATARGSLRARRPQSSARAYGDQRRNRSPPSASVGAVADFARSTSIDWLAVLRRRDALELERSELMATLDEPLDLITRLDRDLKQANARLDDE